MTDFDDSTKQSRKIIQIATAQGELTALCDDGTVWIYDFSGLWVKCEDIPQDEFEREC